MVDFLTSKACLEQILCVPLIAMQTGLWNMREFDLLLENGHEATCYCCRHQSGPRSMAAGCAIAIAVSKRWCCQLCVQHWLRELVGRLFRGLCQWQLEQTNTSRRQLRQPQIPPALSTVDLSCPSQNYAIDRSSTLLSWRTKTRKWIIEWHSRGSSRSSFSTSKAVAAATVVLHHLYS